MNKEMLCKIRHRSYNKLVRCIWKGHKLLWVAGEGQYAVVAPCKPGTKVTLWKSKIEASECLTRRCGDSCARPAVHYILDLYGVDHC